MTKLTRRDVLEVVDNIIDDVYRNPKMDWDYFTGVTNKPKAMLYRNYKFADRVIAYDENFEIIDDLEDFIFYEIYGE